MNTAPHNSTCFYDVTEEELGCSSVRNISTEISLKAEVTN
jgi:hypothetical protein